MLVGPPCDNKEVQQQAEAQEVDKHQINLHCHIVQYQVPNNYPSHQVGAAWAMAMSHGTACSNLGEDKDFRTHQQRSSRTAQQAERIYHDQRDMTHAPHTKQAAASCRAMLHPNFNRSMHHAATTCYQLSRRGFSLGTGALASTHVCRVTQPQSSPVTKHLTYHACECCQLLAAPLAARAAHQPGAPARPV